MNGDGSIRTFKQKEVSWGAPEELKNPGSVLPESFTPPEISEKSDQFPCQSENCKRAFSCSVGLNTPFKYSL
jgi:hypothetical protein